MALATLDDAGRLLDAGVAWTGLAGDALAFAVARCAPGRRLVLVVDDADRAARLEAGLRFFLRDASLLASFPADDARPYDGFSPDASLARARIATLARVDAGGPIVVVAAARALLQPVPVRAVRAAGTVAFAAGEQRDRDALLHALQGAGYLVVARVEAPGCVAVRGDLLDVWPTGADAPVRVDFFDDEIEAVRRIELSTGRAVKKLGAVVALPAREERLDGAALDRLHVALGQQMAAQARGPAMRRRVLDDLRAGVRFAGLEDYLPALVETQPALDALTGLSPIVVYPEDVAAAARDFERLARQRYGALDDEERPLWPPALRYGSADALIERLSGAQLVHQMAPASSCADFGARPVDGFHVRGVELGPLATQLRQLLDQDVRVAVVVEGSQRAHHLEEMFQPHALPFFGVSDPLALKRGRLSLLVGDLSSGFIAADSGWAYLPAGSLFGAATRHQRQREERLHHLFQASLSSLSQLKTDDPVVHRLHGIGRYKGLMRLPVDGVQQDFVQLEYRNGDKLFLPATRLDMLSRYQPAGTDGEVKLDKLGGQTWATRKGKVRDSLLAMARDLLELYARRELATRAPHLDSGAMSAAFSLSFPYEETPDQAAAIEAVHDDLSRPYPMDRLICGDVGFGKTEVALRAVMRVVEGGKQVAVLCPTTVLAMQHVQRFRERFADFGVEVGMLSRFVDGATERDVLDGLRAGRVMIVVGTTKLLGRSVRFHDLGLLVVDEEHRFGVKQKERLKQLRAQVDVLSLSATPIPRTLQMALGGLREMSIMATPPKDRLSVATTTSTLSRARVRDAILQEVERGGQVFVIHNRVETLARFAQTLREWVPEARFATAHGQLADDALETVLVDFVERKFDVLVCTSIVETGIDMPTVNTMLIDRADRFGLSQLYQLRGRVGRADVRGRCILLVPEDVSRDASKRLRVLVEHTELGAGFQIAAADLELRGGGNLLGDHQAGHVDAVGYDTWVELLEEAVQDARGQRAVETLDPEVEVPISAFLPEQLIADPQERLGWYRRVSTARTLAAVDRVIDELEAEFGDLPVEARRLGGLQQVRVRCRELGVARVAWLKVRAVLELHPRSPLTSGQLDAAAQRHAKRIRLVRTANEPTRVELRFTPTDGAEPYRYLMWALGQLSREP